MNEFKFLLKRDFLRLEQKYIKRLMIYVGILAGIDFLLLISAQDFIFKESIVGIQYEIFRENPLSLPYTWLFLQVGIIIILHDFVTEDLFCFAANYIVKIKRRSNFWLSKMAAGLCVTAILGFIHFSEKNLIRSFMNFVSEPPGELISYSNILRGCLLNVACMAIMFCLYSLASLWFREVCSFFICAGILVIGLPSNFLWFPVNRLMLVRGSVFDGMVYCIFISLLLTITGIIKIKKIDLLKKGENYGG